MGRRKPFIDKKSATTYNLLYGDADEQSQANETVNSKDAARPQMGRDFDPFPPEEITWDLPNNKRKEIVELGLPDDGYDYLQHLRDPAANVFSSHDPNVPAAEGPRVFLPAAYVEPPPEDIKYVDARSLPQQTATDDVDILQVLGGVAPFARDLDEQPSNRVTDVNALNDIMRELENADDDADDAGIDDFLDDFVSTAAAKVTISNTAADRGMSQPDTGGEEDSFTEESESSEDSDDDDDARGSRLGHAYVGSIASTYWRPERTDRGEGLSTVDERFEQLALEYDSDELGDLEDVEGGGAGLELYGKLLEKSVAEHSSREPAIEGLHPGQAPSQAAGAWDWHGTTDDGRIAVEKAKELLQASLLDEGADVPVVPASGDGMLHTRQWDCESVLSMQTNLDNHPSLLGEPSSSRRRATGRYAGLSADTNVSSRGDEPSPSGEGDEEAEQGEAPAASRQIMQRSKGETPDEKKQRKELVKLAKREARVIKKDTKIMHKISRCRAAANVGPSQRIVPLSS